MSAQREALIRQAHDQGHFEGDEFMRAETRATTVHELAGAIPTIAQTDYLAKLYMTNYAQLTPKEIALGLQIRRVRAAEASARTNNLYLTEEALRMQRIRGDDGEEIPINVLGVERLRQLRQLGIIAQQPHVNLRLVTESDGLKFGDCTLMDLPDDEHLVAVTANRTMDVFTDPERVKPYVETFAYLAEVAMSPETTLGVIREHIAGTRS